MKTDPCQMCNLPQIAEQTSISDHLAYLLHRLKRILKRRMWYLNNLLRKKGSQTASPTAHNVHESQKNPLQAGDTVRVKSKHEIQGTLNNWNQLKGCSFTEEMWPYCDTEQRVFKRVGQFLDERDYRLKKCRRIVLLEGLICDGTKDFGPCDRSCFYFWREEWLERASS